MTPARRAHIERMVTFLSRNEERGRTVPPIREGGTWDGRAPGDEEDMLEQRQFERDMEEDKGC